MKDKGGEIIREALRKINRRAGVLKSDPYGLGLSLSQASALVDIDRRGRLRPNELAILLHLEKSSVSRMLAILEKDKLIAIDTDENDARSKVITLTKDGRRAVKLINQQADELAAELIEALPASEQKEVVTAFEKLLTALT